jgi:hypothetical protein
MKVLPLAEVLEPRDTQKVVLLMLPEQVLRDSHPVDRYSALW